MPGWRVVSGRSWVASICSKAAAIPASSSSRVAPSGVGAIAKYLNLVPPAGGDNFTLGSTRSVGSVESTGPPSVFQISNKPPSSRPTE